LTRNSFSASAKPVIEAVGFDLDGTLYPNYRLNCRLFPFLLRDMRLLLAFGKARDRIRAAQETGTGLPPGRDFYGYQAELTAEILHAPVQAVKEQIERLIYRGWEPHFKKIRLFPYVVETLRALREAGLKLGMLSDFPPEIKLKNLGIDGLWDTALGSEQTGALKPAVRPFMALAQALDTSPEKILYVGNSFRYDVAGAGRAGMYTALVTRRNPPDRPDSALPGFTFYDYRQLRDFVLQ
jgi:putative hydrolase of the HAD superfamily